MLLLCFNTELYLPTNLIVAKLSLIYMNTKLTENFSNIERDMYNFIM